MRIVYAGSPEYAVNPLKALIAAGKQIVAVVTRPDRPIGRKRVVTPTPVKQFALENGLPVIDCERLRDHVADLSALGADIMITCAYGQLLTQEILNVFPSGVYNLHASLLPKFRGASPIQSAILAGEDYTGVTVMKTELSLDTGDILLVKRTPVGGQTCGELSQKLSSLSALAAVEAVTLLECCAPQLLVQDDSAATYCKKINKQDAAIDFSKPAEEVRNLINAMSPSPAAYAVLNGSPVNFLKAEACAAQPCFSPCGTVLSADKEGVVIACGSGAVRVLFLQFAGGKCITAADAANGRKIRAGEKFD